MRFCASLNPYQFPSSIRNPCGALEGPSPGVRSWILELPPLTRLLQARINEELLWLRGFQGPLPFCFPADPARSFSCRPARPVKLVGAFCLFARAQDSFCGLRIRSLHVTQFASGLDRLGYRFASAIAKPSQAARPTTVATLATIGQSEIWDLRAHRGCRQEAFSACARLGCLVLFITLRRSCEALRARGGPAEVHR